MGRIVACIVLLSVADGCASAGGGGGAGNCGRSALVPSAESLEAWVDSARVETEMAPFLAQTSGLVLATIGPDTTGALQASVFARELPEILENALEGTLIAAARSPLPSQSITLTLRTEQGPRLRGVRDPAMCRPAMRNTSLVEQAVTQEAQGLDLDRTRIVTVWVFVHTDGTVGRTLVQRSSGSVDVDAAALRAIRAARFQPAQIEQIPMEVWVAFPITFQPNR
ncbi:MAG: TonB family protein [Gemmatimonadota bacterium]